MECPICLEFGGTECAPCGFVDSALFHYNCLEEHYNRGGMLCPHCNMGVPFIVLDRLRRILDEWLDTPGLWHKSPLFIPLQRGLMRGKNEEDALRKAVEHVVSAMLLSCAKRNEENIIFASRCGATKNSLVMFHCTKSAASSKSDCCSTTAATTVEESSSNDNRLFYHKNHRSGSDPHHNTICLDTTANTTNPHFDDNEDAKKTPSCYHPSNNTNLKNDINQANTSIFVSHQTNDHHHTAAVNIPNNNKTFQKKRKSDEITKVVLQRSAVSSFDSDSMMALTSCDDGYILSASRKRIVKKKTRLMI